MGLLHGTCLYANCPWLVVFPWLALNGAFIFVAASKGSLFCMQMDLVEDIPEEPSLSPAEGELGDRSSLYFGGSVVKGHCYPKSPISNLLEGRNKHSVRNDLHERGTAGFGLLAIGICSLGSPWVCLATLLELGGC